MAELLRALGQKAKGFNNGPTGPQTKGQWKQPFAWMDKQRSTSLRMPGGSVVGPQVTSAFCGAVATVSDVINANQDNSLATVLVLLGVAIVIASIVGFTRWSPIDLEHLRARRAFGQIVRAARQLYGRHWLPMLAIGAVAVPIIGGSQYLIELVSSVTRGTQADRATCSTSSSGRRPRRSSPAWWLCSSARSSRSAAPA